MQSLKDKILAFHQSLNNKKKHNLNIKSLGFTTYVFHLNKPIIKMKTLSYETQDYNEINNNFINENDSILTIEDFTKGTFLHNELFELDTPPEEIYRRNNHYFDNKPAFNFNHIDLISKKETNSENFQKWVNFLTEKTGRNLYCLKFTEHFNLSVNENDDGYKLGIAVFLISDGKSGEKKNLSNIKNDLKVFFEKNKFEFFKYGFVEYANEIEFKNIEIIKNSLKAALAAVMARNMSHNIGSHVLSRFSHEEDLEEIIRDFNKAQFIVDLQTNWKSSYDSDIKNSLERIRGDSMPDYTKTNFFKKWSEKDILNTDNYDSLKELLAKHELKNKRISIFNNYIKERQELLAEITSTTPIIQTNKRLRADVIERFTDNRILLDRISGVDDFKFSIKVDIKINGKSETDVSVAMANDILGQQALYIILENIIRNTAKHGSKITHEKDWSEKVVFTIRVRESTLNPNYYQITVFDNLKVELDDLVELNNDDPDFYKKHYQDVATHYCESCKSKKEEHTCRINRLTKLVVDQNELINRPILNSYNELRTEALGLIEMEACAAYLRSMPIEKISDPAYDIKFLENERDILKNDIKNGKAGLRILRTVNPLTDNAREKLINNEQIEKGDLNNRENVLGYRFYLPKPQELLILDLDNHLNTDEDAKKEAQKYGVLIVNKNSENIHYNYESNKIYPHEQMLVVGNIQEGIKWEFLPKRYLIINDDTIELYKKRLNEQAYKELKECILKEIVRKKMLDKKISIVASKRDERNRYAEILKIEGEDVKELKFYFDDHGTEYNNYNGDIYFQILTHKEKPFTSENLMPYATAMEEGQLINKMAVLKFMDSCLNNVLILDERIQEKAENLYAMERNKKRPNITYREIWQNVGCFIPHKEEVDLLRTDFKEVSENKSVEKQIKDWMKSMCNGELKIKNDEKIDNRVYSHIDTLIIHVGVIEKCIVARGKGENKECPKTKKAFVESLFEDTDIDVKGINIILTSGRAPKKENLVPEYSFLTLSVIYDYLINNRFKYSLNELCNLARPKI